jgi:hypothetical protein
MNDRATEQSEAEVKVHRVYLLRHGERWSINPPFANMFAAIAYDERLAR